MHLVRFGTHAEQKYLTGDFLGTYDVLVVNANMLAHTASAMASFLAEPAQNKACIIDPQTHAFQHDISLLMTQGKDGKPKLRASMTKLLNIYGEPIRNKVLAERVVTPDDFADTEVTREFARRVGEFQEKTLFDRAEEQGLTKYYEFMGIRPLTPLAIVAPYYYMDSETFADWLPVNVELAKACAEAFPKSQVYAELVIEKELLYNRQAIDRIVTEYGNLPVSTILLWISEFSEHNAPEDLLYFYGALIRDLGKMRPITMLYGSYFSVAIMRFMQLNLTGVCHGPEYGEDRSVIPAVGGLPVSRFYYPDVHKRVRYPDAYRLVKPFLESKDAYQQNVCKCEMCREVMRENTDPDVAFGAYGKSHPVTFQRKYQVVTLDYPDPDTHDKCVRHYMWSKFREYAETGEGQSLEGVIAQLSRTYEFYLDKAGFAEVRHCKTWTDVLRSLSQGQ
ncbi:MAG: hypothetical protein M0Z66_13660 [Thermaerobacter sp.]|nr:hypothetical protein [Thermaerobacter sp.]